MVTVAGAAETVRAKIGSSRSGSRTSQTNVAGANAALEGPPGSLGKIDQCRTASNVESLSPKGTNSTPILYASLLLPKRDCDVTQLAIDTLELILQS
jgi:hypothetical protein